MDIQIKTVENGWLVSYRGDGHRTTHAFVAISLCMLMKRIEELLRG